MRGLWPCTLMALMVCHIPTYIHTDAVCTDTAGFLWVGGYIPMLHDGSSHDKGKRVWFSTSSNPVTASSRIGMALRQQDPHEGIMNP